MPPRRTEDFERFFPALAIVAGPAALASVGLGAFAVQRLWHAPQVQSHGWFWIGAAAGLVMEVAIAAPWAARLRRRMWPFAGGLLFILGGLAYDDRFHPRSSSTSFANPLSHEHRLALAGAAVALAPVAVAVGVLAWRTVRRGRTRADIAAGPVREL